MVDRGTGGWSLVSTTVVERDQFFAGVSELGSDAVQAASRAPSVGCLETGGVTAWSGVCRRSCDGDVLLSPGMKLCKHRGSWKLWVSF